MTMNVKDGTPDIDEDVIFVLQDKTQDMEDNVIYVSHNNTNTPPAMHENSLYCISLDHPYARVQNNYSEETVRQRLNVLAERYPGKMPYQCIVCDLNFLFLKQMREHIANIHPGAINCKFCGISMRSYRDLQKHFRRCKVKNSGLSRDTIQQNKSERRSNKPFRCSLCGVGSSDNRMARRHLHEHFSQRPYACKICGNSFVSEEECNAHERSHQTEDVMERHICNICGQSFVEFIQLEEHFSTHSKMTETKGIFTHQMRTNNKNENHRMTPKAWLFNCGECHEQFETIPELRIHFKVHMHLYTNTTYKCDVCFRELKTMRILRRHKAIHDGDFPIMCWKCGSGFFYECVYRMHCKTCLKPGDCDRTENFINEISDISRESSET